MTIDSQYLSHYHRLLWEEPNCLVVVGDLSGATRGREAYVGGFGIQVREDGELDDLLLRLLGAAGLAAVSLSERESWGWTLALPGIPVGLFCAVEPEGRICGRIRAADVERKTAAIQRKRPDGPLVQSHLEPPSVDPADTVQRYFTNVVQVPTRIEQDADGRGALVQALPGGTLGGLEEPEPRAFVDRCFALADEEATKRLDEVLLFYDCRCSDERILEMLASLPDAQRRELWGDRTSLETECPRCGRTYTVRRMRAGDLS